MPQGILDFLRVNKTASVLEENPVSLGYKQSPTSVKIIVTSTFC